MGSVMDVISLSKVCAFDVIHGQRDALDYSLFHGIAHNDVGQLREFVPGAILPGALRLTRLGANVPAVFSPLGNLVVCERLWHAVAGFRVEAVEVQFQKLVDFKRRQKLSRELSNHTWERLQNVPEYHVSIDRYFELLSVPFRVFSSHFPEIAQTARKVKVTNRRESVEYLSQEMLETYPLIATMSGTIVPYKLFEILGPDLDREFFEVGPVLSI